MTEAYKWQLFAMGFIWAVLIIKVFPPLLKDIVAVSKELFIIFFEDVRKLWTEYRKSSAEGKSAEQANKKQLKYSVSEYKKINKVSDLRKWY